MRLAYFSPLPPERSGIADYSAELLPHLAAYADIDIFTKDCEQIRLDLAKNFPIFNYDAFSRQKRQRLYDINLYHMGNHPLHLPIYQELIASPGIIILHELMLHHFFYATTLLAGRWSTYLRELWYNGAIEYANSLLAGQGAVLTEYPLSSRLIDVSLAIIVHNHYAARLVLEASPATQVAVVPMGIPLPSPVEALSHSKTLRQELGLPEDAYIVGAFGHLSAAKRLNILLQAFARLKETIPQTMCLLVGQAADIDIEQICADVGLRDNIRCTGYVETEDFYKYLKVADVCVNLRYPSYGETSATALRIMAAGKAMIVSKIGSLAELPDDSCVKLNHDKTEVELLYRYLQLLYEREDMRWQMGRNAQLYIEREHTVVKSAKKYVEFIQQVSDKL